MVVAAWLFIRRGQGAGIYSRSAHRLQREDLCSISMALVQVSADNN